jgi:hypothetical protein
VAIVGDLPQSSSKDEYRRRLNAVRDRIQSNFGMEIPFNAMGQAAKPAPTLRPQPGPTASGRGQPPSSAPRAVNPQTGETIEWNGSAWVKVQ